MTGSTQPETAAVEAALKAQHPDMEFTHVHSGKVREIFETDGGNYLVLVATDRISAFDVVMKERIPEKGVVLNNISARMFEELGDLTQHHLLNPNFLPDGEFAGRASLVQKLTAIPLECIVRALITGSMWKAFQKAEEVDGVKTVLGFELPASMEESQRFPDPLFTPSTKAEVGHDENLTEDEARALLASWVEGLPEGPRADWTGDKLFDALRKTTLALFEQGSEYATERGIILADTKFEFGLNEVGTIVLMDEALTPDSSRFSFEEDYEVGKPLVCQDKQILRNYLQKLVDAGEWDKEAPPPELPQPLVDEIREVYLDMHHRITGNSSLLSA